MLRGSVYDIVCAKHELDFGGVVGAEGEVSKGTGLGVGEGGVEVVAPGGDANGGCGVCPEGGWALEMEFGCDLGDDVVVCG